MDEVRLRLFIAAVPMLLAIGPAIFKAAGMRARAHNEWAELVVVTKGALESIATDQLLKIYNQVHTQLDPSGQFRRDQSPFQPFEVDDTVARYGKAARYWKRIDVCIKWKLRVGPTFVCILALAVLPVAAFAAYGLGSLESPLLQRASIALGGVVVVLLCLSLLAHVILEHYMTNAQIFGKGVGEDQ